MVSRGTVTTRTASWRVTVAGWHAWVLRHADGLALAILGGAFAWRVLLAALGWPATDSDEGTMGLMARHIAYAGAHPIFFYGQAYMGALEAYLAAALFRLIGPSLFALRLAVILLSMAALGCVYLLARRLYTPGLALFALGLLALGPPEALDREIFAGGGYVETLLFSALALLLAHALALSAATGVPRSWRQLVAYAGLGLAVGLGLWSDTLVVPFMLGALLLAARFCRRELLSRAGICLLLGFVVGVGPLLAYAAQAPGHNPLAGAAAVEQSSNAYQGNLVSLVAGEIAGTVAVSVPSITGGSALLPLAPKSAWPLPNLTPGAAVATLVHAIWGLGTLALLAIALVAGWRVVRGRGPEVAEHVSAEHAARVDAWARALLVGGAALTVLLFVASPVAARAPAEHARYLIGMLLALPALLDLVWRRAWGRASLWHGGAQAVLGLVFVVFLAGAVQVAQGVPAARAVLAQQAQVMALLERNGVHAVFGEYWTCDRLAFLSGERVICASLDPYLRPDLDRYLPYRADVAADPHAWYVFPVTSPQAAAFAARAASSPGGYTRSVAAGYVFYAPEG